MGKIHIFNFFAGVNDATVGKLTGQISEAISRTGEDKPDSILLRISSMGGQLHSCFTGYNFLRSVSALVPITAVNLANVESAALILYLAADTRHTVPLGKFGVHQFGHVFEDCAEYSQMVDQIKLFDTDVERYCRVFDERTAGAQRPVDIHKNLHGIPWFPDTHEAIETGIAQTVVTPESTEDEHAVRWWVTA